MKKRHLASLLFGLLLVNTACQDIDRNDIYQEEFHKILYLKTSGIIDMTLYKTGEDTKYDFSIVKAGAFPELTADVYLENMTDEELKEYCEPRGLNLKRLPETCYDLSASDIHFTTEDRYKIITMSLHTNEIDNVMANEPAYVIPVLLKSKNDSINTNRNILIIRPQVIIPSIAFKNKGLITTYCPLGETTIEIPLEIQIDNKWDFTCQVEVDATASGYSILQKGYTLENNGVVHFNQGSRSSILRAKINRAVAELEEVDMRTVVLPLRIKSISIPTFNIDKTELVIGVSSKYPLTPNMLYTNAQEYYEGPLANILDGSIATYFHSSWSSPIEGKHYVQVNLPQAISSFKFSYTNRNTNGNAALASFNVSVSTNGTNFTSIRDFEKTADGLPGTAAGVYNSPKLESSTPFKSIRFTCNSNWSGSPFFVWSEFSLYGL